MTRHILLLAATAAAAIVASGGRLAAQAPEKTENPAKIEATRFEMALRLGLELAGQRLAQQARQVAPDLTLQVSDPAVARGVKLDNYGFHFDVQAPDITSTMIVWDMMNNQRLRSPVQPITSGGVPSQQVVAPAIVPFDPDQAYTSYVKEALIDVILDNSGVLSLAAGEYLTVTVSGIDQPTPNPLYRKSADKLMMTIRATDLVDFRQGRITREQVKDRIAQKRF